MPEQTSLLQPAARDLATRRDWAFALGGPAALGALIGSAADSRSILLGAVRLPGIVLGVAVLMGPAFYVVAARLGLDDVALPQLALAARSALVRAGRVMLGVLPVVGFLGLACKNAFPMLVAAPLLAAVAALIGLRSCEQALFSTAVVRETALRVFPAATTSDARARGRMLFGVWSVLTMAVAATAYFRIF
jgi:hypothetical protein